MLHINGGTPFAAEAEEAIVGYAEPTDRAARCALPKKPLAFRPGAADGDRTRVLGLEGRCSAIELLPHNARLSGLSRLPGLSYPDDSLLHRGHVLIVHTAVLLLVLRLPKCGAWPIGTLRVIIRTVDALPLAVWGLSCHRPTPCRIMTPSAINSGTHAAIVRSAATP